MIVYRIVQNRARTNDLSGTGAHRVGGRWNTRGTYMLYTSENSSLAMLEALVHFDRSLTPPNLFIMHIEVDDAAPVYTVPDADYPADWLTAGLIANQLIGDRLMNERNYLGIGVRSAVNRVEYNYLLNPLFPGYARLVRVIDVIELPVDSRLVGK